MTKHTVAELTDVMLDAAVAKACGLDYEVAHGRVSVKLPYFRVFSPSGDWAWGGQIISGEGISVMTRHNALIGEGEWNATCQGAHVGKAHGDTPLVAAMRAFVMSKFGAEVDL